MSITTYLGISSSTLGAGAPLGSSSSSKPNKTLVVYTYSKGSIAKNFIIY